VGGHRAGLLAAAAYLSIGLFQLPVFHGGGGTVICSIRASASWPVFYQRPGSRANCRARTA
jgi:biotin transporter BioY